MDKLLDWRKEFPILDNTVYMISHSLGAMPRRTRDRLQEYADMWATRGIRSWEEGWWMMPTTVGDLIGKIIGAGAGEVVMHQNVSVCQSIINSCFNFSEGRRNKIVSESLNFPSNLYIYNALVQDGAQLGFRRRTPRRAGADGRPAAGRRRRSPAVGGARRSRHRPVPVVSGRRRSRGGTAGAAVARLPLTGRNRVRFAREREILACSAHNRSQHCPTFADDFTVPGDAFNRPQIPVSSSMRF